MYSIYNTMGFLLFIWYACIRWTMLADRIKFDWAYTDINLATAFLSIPFLLNGLIPLFDQFIWFVRSFYFIGLFLWSRNIYYAIEDIYDYIHKAPTKQQAFFIAVDILMIMFTTYWLIRYRNIVL